VGEHDPDAAARAAVQAVSLGVVVSIVLGVAGWLLAPTLLRVMGASPAVLAMGTGYTRVMLGGNAAILLLFLVNAIFRGAGDPAIAMRTLWLANAINIVLAPCLIFGPGPFPALGVTGAAVATTIGRGTGALYALSRLVRRRDAEAGHLVVRRRHLRLEPAVMARILRLSGAGTLQVLIGSASWIGLIRILSSFGSDAVAGYTIAIRIVLFVLLPSWGLSNAAATMVGQALGAGKPERAEQAVWRAGFYNVCVLGTMGALFVLFAPQIVALFAPDETARRIAVDGLRIIALGFPFYAYGMVLTQSFNGAGETRTPTLLNFLVFWLWEIPLASALALWLDVGPRGVFIAVAVAFSTLAAASAVMFRRGRWKAKRV
jgi:putative MATE family efflux protein